MCGSLLVDCVILLRLTSFDTRMWHLWNISNALTSIALLLSTLPDSQNQTVSFFFLLHSPFCNDIKKSHRNTSIIEETKIQHFDSSSCVRLKTMKGHFHHNVRFVKMQSPQSSSKLQRNAGSGTSMTSMQTEVNLWTKEDDCQYKYWLQVVFFFSCDKIQQINHKSKWNTIIEL